jgi:hypothetical protein
VLGRGVFDFDAVLGADTDRRAGVTRPAAPADATIANQGITHSAIRPNNKHMMRRREVRIRTGSAFPSEFGFRADCVVLERCGVMHCAGGGGSGGCSGGGGGGSGFGSDRRSRRGGVFGVALNVAANVGFGGFGAQRSGAGACHCHCTCNCTCACGAATTRGVHERAGFALFDGRRRGQRQRTARLSTIHIHPTKHERSLSVVQSDGAE